ncbi:MAG TPA: hypothetical protein VGB85_19725 [Nannocystis sp.]|jgi:hypothetical protein
MRSDRFVTLLRERTPDRGATVVGPVRWIEPPARPFILTAPSEAVDMTQATPTTP